MRTIKELMNLTTEFRDERDWKQFHNPKDLAMCISIEAAELLEVFQWSGEDLYVSERKDRIKEELADVINYCFLMADCCGLDVGEIVSDKIEKNRKKYPAEEFYGSSRKYNELKDRKEE